MLWLSLLSLSAVESKRWTWQRCLLQLILPQILQYNLPITCHCQKVISPSGPQLLCDWGSSGQVLCEFFSRNLGGSYRYMGRCLHPIDTFSKNSTWWVFYRQISLGFDYFSADRRRIQYYSTRLLFLWNSI